MRDRRRQRGFILIATLFTALSMAAVGIGFSLLNALDLKVNTQRIAALQAYYLAEAGMADALDTIRDQGRAANTTWTSNFPDSSLNQYSVTVSENGTLIRRTGTQDTSGFSRRLEARVSILGTSKPFGIRIHTWKEIAP